MSPLELLATTAAAITGLTIVGGALGWLLWPRVEERFEQIARSIGRVEQQTGAAQVTQPDTLAAHAKRAAQAAAEIPAIHEKIALMAEKQDALDAWQRATDSRLLKLEEALIALMADELRGRLRRD